VGGRLLRDQAKPATAVRTTPSETVVIGLDGGYGALSSARFGRVQVPPVLE